jgi:hypothetical protein
MSSQDIEELGTQGQALEEQEERVRYNVRPKTRFYAMITVPDHHGGREIIWVKRVPAWLDTFGVKKLKRRYVVALTHSELTLKGLPVVFYNILRRMPMSVTVTADNLTLSDLPAKASGPQKMYSIQDTRTLDRLVGAVSVQQGLFSSPFFLGIMLGATTGALLMFMFYHPAATAATNSTVRTVTKLGGMIVGALM